MLSRRKFIQTTAALTAAAMASPARAGTRPVILDTDIGDDIDDTWALGAANPRRSLNRRK